MGNFNPHSPCGERRCSSSSRRRPGYFNPHSPCGERRDNLLKLVQDALFQSTLPLRGATRFGSSRSAMSPFQSTLLLRERPSSVMTAWSSILFQSTLPLRGTTTRCQTSCAIFGFQSTFPLRGATRNRDRRTSTMQISIHAPLAGNDLRARFAASRYPNFNPRSPCGERLASMPVYLYRVKFQSTLPLRGTTLHESDNKGARTNFNPRSPCGERPEGHRLRDCADRISIHAPLAGNDSAKYYETEHTSEFQSTLPLRGTTIRSGACESRCIFQSTLPLRGTTRQYRLNRPS